MSLALTLEIFRSVQADDPFAFRTGPQEYVFRSPLGGVETATLNWDEPLLQDLAALRLPSCSPALLQRVGERLRQFVAPTHFARAETELLAAVERGQTPIITLRMSAAELYALPWELLALKATGQYLGALPGVLLRYAWPETRTPPEEPSPRPEGGRILMVWSAAGGAVPAAEHQQAIARACRLGNHPFDPALDVLPQVSYQQLADALDQARQREPIAALHILCHGAAQQGLFGLAWNGEGAGVDRQLIDAAQLRQLLGGHASRLRLVVIAACDSANSGQLGNQLGSLAQTLHRAGIAGVVASRYPLSVAGSIQLTQALYGTLLSGPASVESAFRAARQRLARSAQSLDWAGLQLYARPEDGDDSRPLVQRPYRGLEPFFLPHRRFFFGREKERQQARAALHALDQAGQPRFLIVAGASGTGKSSVVLGGLVPDLTESAAAPDRPGEASAARRALDHLRGALGSYADRPPLSATLAALGTAVEALAASPDGPWEWALMRPGPEPLAALTAALAGRRDPGRPLLLCVDQFEELFTHCADPQLRCAFAARLWALSREPTGIYCVVTLRVDFFGRCGELVLDPGGLRLDRVAYSEPHRVFVAQLEPAELAMAISGPARLVGLELKEGLVQRMLAEVAGEPGALPLLSYVLDLLWQRRQGPLLTEAGYAELGGVGGALGNNADRALAGLVAADQRLAQKLLVRLVGFTDSGGAETRKRVPLAELQAQIADPQERLAGVLAAFVNARLLVRSEDRGQTVIEVAHEALIRKWERLRSWLGEDRQRLAEVRELVQWATQYSTYGTLLRGSQLGYAQRVRQKYPDELGRIIPKMISASVAAQRGRRLVLTVAITGVLCALSALSLYARQSQHVALRASRSATDKARIAQSRLLGLLAAREVATQPAAALLLATRAVTMHKEFQSRSVLAATLERTRPIRAFVPVPAGHIYGLAFSPDGQTLAVTGQAPEVWLYDGRTGARVGKRPVAKNVEINAVAWSPDGRLLAGGGSDGGIWLWDAADTQLAAVRVPTSGRSIYSLDFSDDGKTLAAGSQDGRVWLLDMLTRRLLAPLSGHTQLVAAVSFRPGDSTSLATGSSDGTIRVFDVKAGTLRLGPLVAHQGLSSNVAWSPDGQLLATGSEDHSVLLWQASTGKLHGEPLLHHRAAVSGTSFSPDGRLLASCGLDGAIVIWEVATGRPIGKELRGHHEPVQNCTWSRDGHSLASSSEGQVVLWDLADHPALHRQQMAVAVTALALAPGRQYAAIGSRDGSVRLWQLAAERPGAPEQVEAGAVNAVAFSPDGQRLAAAGKSGGVALLQVHAGALALAGRLIQHRSPALTLAFDQSGHTLAAGHADGTLLLWDVASGRLRTPPLGSRQQSITALAFSPQGGALVTGGFDGSITWRNPTSGVPLCDFRSAHQDEVTSLSFDPQGNYLASASRDKTLGLWRRTAVPPGCPVAAAEPLGRDAPAVSVTAVSFSADGRTLLAGDEAGAVTLWDVQARQAIGPPRYGHLQPITALATGSAGWVLSGDEETIWRWDGNEAAWPAQACARANRNLSGSEWQLYLDPSPYCRICPTLPAGPGAPPEAPACDPS